MISISPVLYDIRGALQLIPTTGSDILAGERRIYRSPTLDGGVAIYDAGFSHGDRTLNVVVRGATQQQVLRAAELVEETTTVTVSTPDGVYIAALASYRYADGSLIVSILIRARLDGEDATLLE